jgi:hypothetical protein
MNPADVESSLVFYGNIPPNSTKEHLGIVLVCDDLDVQYCYCTSQSSVMQRHNDHFYIIEEEDMKVYFPNNAKESYIVLSQAFIFKILSITFVDRINTGEFGHRGLLDKNIFNGLIQAIFNSDYISEEFKRALNCLIDPQSLV